MTVQYSRVALLYKYSIVIIYSISRQFNKSTRVYRLGTLLPQKLFLHPRGSTLPPTIAPGLLAHRARDEIPDPEALPQAPHVAQAARLRRAHAVRRGRGCGRGCGRNGRNGRNGRQQWSCGRPGYCHGGRRSGSWSGRGGWSGGGSGGCGLGASPVRPPVTACPAREQLRRRVLPRAGIRRLLHRRRRATRIQKRKQLATRAAATMGRSAATTPAAVGVVRTTTTAKASIPVVGPTQDQTDGAKAQAS